MSKWMKFCGSTAIVTLMTGSAAFADVTAQEVWSDWKSYFESFGYEVTSTEATSDGTLTVSDMKMNISLPEDAGSMSVDLGELSFTNQGDGTVAVSLPASQVMKINVMPKGEDPVDIALDYTNEGLEMVVSGSANDMTYTYSAAAIGVKLKELVAEGQVVPIGAAEMTVRDVNGSSSMKVGNLRDLAQSMKAGAVTYNLDFANPDDDNEFIRLNGTVGQLEFNGTGSYPTGGFDTNNLGAMLKAGFAFAGKFTHGGGNTNFQFIDGKENVQGTSSSESGAFEIEMSEDVLKYIVSGTGVAMNMQVPDLPFPVDIKMGESGFKLVMPVSKSDEAQDFAFGMTMRDFTTSDMIWGMVDPGGQLPHDPATVAVDLSGKAKLGFDLMDPEQMEAVERGEMGIPGEVESLSINDIEVTAAGASLTGKGGFMFDFPTVLMSSGMQGVDGAIDLTLSGANGLMQKLVEMGLLPQDQVMGAQMMMGMFAVPAGDDVYTSKIEVKSDGQILANGQRLQ